VGGAAVVGDDHPVQAVLRGAGHLLGDQVLGVGAVLGVDVVITREPEQASRVDRAGSVVALAALVRVRRSGVGAGQHTRTCGCRTEQASAMQERPAAELGRGQLGLGDRQVKCLGQRLGCVVAVRVVVRVVVDVVLAHETSDRCQGRPALVDEDGERGPRPSAQRWTSR